MHQVKSSYVCGLAWLLSSLSVVIVVCLAGPLWAEGGREGDNAPQSDPAQSEVSPASADGDASVDEDEDEIFTDAERIGGLQQLIEDDQQRLEQLRTELRTLEARFEQVSEQYNRCKAEWTAKKGELENASNTATPAQLANQQTELAELAAQRALAEKQFNLIIKRRKVIQLQIPTLEEKILLEQEELARASGEEVDSTTEPATATQSSAGPSAESASIAASPESPWLPNGLSLPEAASSVPASRLVKEPSLTMIDPEVEKARRHYQEKKHQLEAVEKQIERMSHGIEVFEKDMAQEKELAESAAQQQRLAVDQLRRLDAQLKKQQSTDADDDTIAATKKEVAQARKELDAANAAFQLHQSHVEDIAKQLAAVGEEYEAALAKLPNAEAEATNARRWLRWMEGPLAPHKIINWLLSRGPRILVVLLVMLVFYWLIRVLGGHAIRGLAQRSRSGTALERQERTQTLLGVYRSFTTIGCLAIGLLAVLDQAGMDITVFLGGAAALGVAIGFGAQNLMRDYFYGSMILAENQYRVGNVVRIAGISGTVESISLRVTVLRDLEGVAHFIPHSQISTVSNLTQGWSRAMFEIGVAYHENVDRVMEVLMEIGQQLHQEEGFADLVIGEPEMLGVDALGDSAVVIKFLIKTRPLQQWVVKREMLRRIKNRFDELGIEIPFPHRTIYHRDLNLAGRNSTTEMAEQ